MSSGRLEASRAGQVRAALPHTGELDGTEGSERAVSSRVTNTIDTKTF